MSTKTIAVEISVYKKLAGVKRPSESFTKTIDRLLDATAVHTCADAVEQTAKLWGEDSTKTDADRMEQVIAETRARTDWTPLLPE